MKLNLPVLAASMLIKEGVKFLVERIKKSWRKRKVKKFLQKRKKQKDEHDKKVISQFISLNK